MHMSIYAALFVSDNNKMRGGVLGVYFVLFFYLCRRLTESYVEWGKSHQPEIRGIFAYTTRASAIDGDR